jgi:hypothetical protein
MARPRKTIETSETPVTIKVETGAPETALVVKEPQQELSIESIIQSAITNNVPVETMERLLAMRRELKQEAAKEAYDRAMATFQSECPTIKKTKPVYTKSGQLAYEYAPIESIVQQVAPYLQKHGFSYSTGMELKEKGVKVTCRITHELGHSEESTMEVPFGTQTQMMSNTQVTAAATTFAKRYAFCNAFGILTGDEDNDAKPVATEPMKPYTVARAIPAHDDEAQGQRRLTPMTPINDSHGLDEPKDHKGRIKEYLTTLGKTPITQNEARYDIKSLTGIFWKPSENDEEIVNSLAKLVLAKESMDTFDKEMDEVLSAGKTIE